jgi:hypothetical protein
LDGEAGMDRLFDGFLAAHSINIEAEPTPDAVVEFPKAKNCEMVAAFEWIRARADVGQDFSLDCFR